jgi:hypothetical protein
MQRREAIQRFPKIACKAMTARSRGLDLRIGLAWLTGLILLLLLAAPTLTAEPAKAVRAIEAIEEALPHVSSPPPPAAMALSLDAATDQSGRAGPAGGADSAAGQPDRPDEALDAAVAPEDTADAVQLVPADEDPSIADLEEFLFTSNFGSSSWKPATVDEALAIAVAKGSGPELKRRNPFRKRSRDLFRTDFRQVKVGRAEMLMRLRLRAKSRNAISVEVRF